ncbi:hypothetical protein NPIL_671541 [Nephila pilipes]|uniref:RNase H type-1 domain-containing protein n=1 Tax=Nephila pilipes TaxID=299642 RepID=A0A8X6N314_NEPPI|nr:hypothetical protein NPIL_671541 [Nephila pilipes]
MGKIRTLQWIPARVGIVGNEAVDELAKVARTFNFTNSNPVTQEDATLGMRQLTNWPKWQELLILPTLILSPKMMQMPSQDIDSERNLSRRLIRFEKLMHWSLRWHENYRRWHQSLQEMQKLPRGGTFSRTSLHMPFSSCPPAEVERIPF